MIQAKCEDCRYWEMIDGKGGICKRFPPNSTGHPVQVMRRIVQGNRPSPTSFMGVTSWPKTTATDWCGEFRNDE